MIVDAGRDPLSMAASFAALRDYAGPDPYDGLLSPFAGVLTKPRLRQIWVQLNKRGGNYSRKLASIPPVKMAKTLALFAQGHAVISDLATANRLVDELLERSSGGPWGYEFDVQTRWAHYRAGTPNIVATTFVLRALDAVGRISEVSPDVANWVVDLWDPRGYFKYTAASDRLIHNGSLLAAESLCRLAGSSSLIEKATHTTVAAQEADGSWPYGRGDQLSWKDSFHTVYVIDSLSYLQQHGVDTGDSVQKARTHWTRDFFTKSGLPKYFPNSRKASRDIHNVATCLGALAKYEWDSEHMGKLKRTKDHLLAFQSADGGFRTRSRNPVFMRWDQGHAFLALCEVARQERRDVHEG
jgi:hypothetical protein